MTCTAMQVSVDGLLCCTISSDRSVKLYDVVNYDMMVMIRLPYVPSVVEWVYQQGDVKVKLAISDRNLSFVHIYDARAGSNEPIISREIHLGLVKVMRYNSVFHCVIFADEKGIIEYWSPATLQFLESDRVGEPMELCSKTLKATDVGVRLSFPTAAMREHFRLEEGIQSLDFQVRDKDREVWTFRLYTSKNKGHPKPVLTKGWIGFVKRKNLRVGDKLIFLVHESGDQLGIRVQRKIKLFGQESGDLPPI
ncbi:hypothetical protein CRYUN_Cryun04dG0050000 [Craigia yunnanensis]